MKKSVFALLAVCILLTGCSESQHTRNQPAVPREQTAPSIWVENHTQPLATIELDDDQVIGFVNIANHGTETLQITSVQGSGKCFVGHTGDKTLKPGHAGVIEVKFDKNEIPSGTSTRSVSIISNDPERPSIDIKFAFNIERNLFEEQVREFSDELVILRRDIQQVRTGLTKTLHQLNTKKLIQGRLM